MLQSSLRTSRFVRAIVCRGFLIGLFIVLFGTDLVQAQSWQYIAPVLLARERPDCALLPDGRILLIGGEIQPTAINECEIYDPKSDTWSITGSLNTPRFWFAHATLQDGRIFVAGGWTLSNSNPTNTCEIYDPASGTWEYTASMARTRTQFEAITLPNGKVLILGGTDSTSSDMTNLAEKFDPATETMSTIDNPQPSCYGYEMVYSKTLNGIIAAGGVFQLSFEHPVGLVQFYDLNTSKWKLLSPLIEAEEGYNQLVETPEGNFALMAGRNENRTTTKRVQVFNPTTLSWSTGGFLPYGHDYGSSFDVQGDSIITIGGLDIPGDYPTVEACDLIDLKTGKSWIGPAPNVNRTSQAAIMIKSFDTMQCTELNTVYLFTCEAALLDYTSTCESITYTFSQGANSTLSIPTVSQISQSSCVPSETAIPVKTLGCSFISCQLDSIWLTGSSAFQITDSRSEPRSLATLDSILVSYAGTHGPDTALLHLQYNLGSGAKDTTIQLIGVVSTPFTSQPAQIHRESASSYFGHLDSLTLGVDLSSQINIDSLWPYITEIQATYSWDSSLVSYVSYLAPNGWVTSSVTHTGNTVNFDIQNISSFATQPVDLGTALFRPSSTQLSSSWVVLPSLTIYIGGQAISLCVTDNEDNHWAVKTLGVQSGVEEVSIVSQEISVYPNPAGDELFVKNDDVLPASIAIYDVIGREVLDASAPALTTSSIEIESLPSGVYFVVCHLAGRMETKSVTKQ